jgi:hypothetical protein
VDAVLCRRVLCDMPEEEALRALANIRASGARFLLATTRTLTAGASRCRDLINPPFGLSMPAQLLMDADDSVLAVWRLAPAPEAATLPWPS